MELFSAYKARSKPKKNKTQIIKPRKLLYYMNRENKRDRTPRLAETRFPFTVLGGMPYSDLPLRKELVVRREVRETFFEILKLIPIRHLEGLTEIIVGKFQDKSHFLIAFAFRRARSIYLVE